MELQQAIRLIGDFFQVYLPIPKKSTRPNQLSSLFSLFFFPLFRSSSRSTANTPTSSAIHSKSQPSSSSTKPAASSSSTSSLSAAAVAARPWLAATSTVASRSAPTSTSNISAATSSGKHGTARPKTATSSGDAGGGGGGSLPLSPSHQPPSSRKPRDRSLAATSRSSADEKQVVPTQQVKQQPQQPIRTTRSSRLRAAALGKATAVCFQTLQRPIPEPKHLSLPRPTSASRSQLASCFSLSINPARVLFPLSPIHIYLFCIIITSLVFLFFLVLCSFFFFYLSR